MQNFMRALWVAIALSACNPPPAGTDAGPPPVDAATTPDMATTPDANVTRFPASCDPQTFVLTSDGTSYTFGGSARDPVLTLCQGVTYTFDLSAVGVGHPFEIMAGSTSVALVHGGTTGTYMVPSAAPFPTSYDCMIHGFGNTITVVAP